MFFRRAKEPVHIGFYRTLRRMRHDQLAHGVATGRGTRYVAYSRGCGGGASFLVREEAADGACHAFAILALYEDGGIERSSFASGAEATAFVAAAVDKISRG